MLGLNIYLSIPMEILTLCSIILVVIFVLIYHRQSIELQKKSLQQQKLGLDKKKVELERLSLSLDKKEAELAKRKVVLDQREETLDQLTLTLHQKKAELEKYKALLDQKSQTSEDRPLPNLQTLYREPTKQPMSAFEAAKNRELKSKLLTLLQNDAAAAKRLVGRQRQEHPGQADNWYLEKVIHDLERDRH